MGQSEEMMALEVQDTESADGSKSDLLQWDIPRAEAMKLAGECISRLQETIPVSSGNDGLPVAYISATQILESGFHLKRTQSNPEEMAGDDLMDVEGIDDPNGNGSTALAVIQPPEGSVIALDYSEGYPAVDGLPFWERLEGETTEFYNLFKRYRDMRYELPKGYKGKLSTQPNTRVRPGYKGRAISVLSVQVGTPARTLKSLSMLYHWAIRAKAYDMYRNALYEQQRQLRIAEMENRHYTTAKRVFESCVDFLHDHVEEMSIKDAREWAELAIKLERLSVGMLPDKPAEVAGANIGTQVNITAATQNVAVAPGSGVGANSNRLGEILGILIKQGALPQSVTSKLVAGQGDVIDAEYIEHTLVPSPPGTREGETK